jgi:hypothetical protein
MTDSQLRPGFTAPQQCAKGCARWDNLAADGNTSNQNDVNAKWSGGSPPQGASNTCAQPANDQNTGPWCYCAGTNDSSMGLCQDRNLAASACKAIPNGLNNLTSQLNSCTSATELTRNTNFAENTIQLQTDIHSLGGIITDSLIMGDTMFGQSGYGDVINQVKQRNVELKSKKDLLMKSVDKNEAVIERADRDFSDVNNLTPKPLPKRVLNFVEDYTLAFLAIAYLFMIIAIIYVYTATSDLKLIGFGKALIGSIFLTIFLFMMMFYLV